MPSYKKKLFYKDNKVYAAGVMAGGCLSQRFLLLMNLVFLMFSLNHVFIKHVLLIHTAHCTVGLRIDVLCVLL
jgi:hypothetical protein